MPETWCDGFVRAGDTMDQPIADIARYFRAIERLATQREQQNTGRGHTRHNQVRPSNRDRNFKRASKAKYSTVNKYTTNGQPSAARKPSSVDIDKPILEIKIIF